MDISVDKKDCYDHLARKFNNYLVTEQRSGKD